MNLWIILSLSCFIQWSLTFSYLTLKHTYLTENAIIKVGIYYLQRWELASKSKMFRVRSKVAIQMNTSFLISRNGLKFLPQLMREVVIDIIIVPVIFPLQTNVLHLLFVLHPICSRNQQETMFVRSTTTTITIGLSFIISPKNHIMNQ